ncbi:MAG: biotin carboxyl carrier protein [Kiritimatiellia bacterium]
MRTAIVEQDQLVSPTVGTWMPAVGLGAPLHEGDVLGHLMRAGREVAVVAPAGAAGVAIVVTPSGTWCAYGRSLVTMGAGGAELAAPAEVRSIDLPDGVFELRCDIDGTVYLRPEPGAEAFVAVGDAVEALRTVALVEVMKTFTPVRVERAGTIVAIRVDDSAAVEAGDTLFWIRNA